MSFSSNQVCILVHGTWGSESDWHQPEDPFYVTIKTQLNASNIKLIKFTWSGVLSHEKRILAGRELANLIDSYPNTTKFIIIAHSHGSNVGIIASQKLNHKYKIERFYALGTPVDLINYLPNMQVIQHFYHIFSFGDIFQTVLGVYERVFPFTPRLYNLNIEVNNKMPGHEELHCQTIAKWLLQIHPFLQEFNYNNQFFTKFYDNIKPQIMIDVNFEAKRAQDVKLHAQICYTLPNGHPDWRLSRPTQIGEAWQLTGLKSHSQNDTSLFPQNTLLALPLH